MPKIRKVKKKPGAVPVKQGISPGISPGAAAPLAFPPL